MATEEQNTIMPTSPAGQEKRTYSVPEIAEILQISKSKAYALCKQSLFKSVKIGKYVRVSKTSFDAWLDSVE
jgi:excisionase family DNA binding protein